MANGKPGLFQYFKLRITQPIFIFTLVCFSVKPPGSTEDEITDEIGIVKQFQFSSDHQSMSVIVRDLSAMNFKIFCKGSPEKMKMISNPESIPDNFHQILDRYTESGFRVIALAMRTLPANTKLIKIDKMERNQVEKDLTLLGKKKFLAISWQKTGKKRAKNGKKTGKKREKKR